MRLMKQYLLTGTALMTALTVGAHAYNGWGVGLGVWNASDIDTGVGPVFKVSIEMVPEVQLDLRASYFGSFDGHRQDVSVLPLEANLAVTYELTPILSGYAGAGVGYYLIDGGRTGGDAVQKPDPDNEFGFQLLGGLELPVKENASVFAEVQYRVVEAYDAEVFGTEVSDLDLAGFGVNLGLMIRW